MEKSPFSRLPAELRNNIFKLALQQRRRVQLVFRPRWRSPGEHPTHYEMLARPSIPGPHPLALTQVCRQIRKETKNFFWHLNTFRFPVSLMQLIIPPPNALMFPHSAEGLLQWLHRQDAETLRLIGGIALDAGTWKVFCSGRLSTLHMSPDVGQSLRELSDSLAFLAPMGVAVSLHFKVYCIDVPTEQKALVVFVLPLHDHQALRSVVSATMEKRLAKATADQSGGNGAGSSSAGQVAIPLALQSCQDAMEEMLKAFLKNPK